MDELMNAGKAAGFAAAKGKKIKAKGIYSQGSGMEPAGTGFKTFGDDINNALDEIGRDYDVIWIATMAAPRSTHGYMMGAIIYYVER